jgi:broad specificity phosphatase PhoE
MSTLTVIRHGQARPFEKDSDRLSETGEHQSRALAAYWARLGVTFDVVYSGDLLRHHQTAALSVAQTVTADPDWNEYDAGGVLKHFAPPFDIEEVGPDRNRRFQMIFEPAMQAWMAAESHPHVEIWKDFRTRVLRGLRKIQEGPSNRRVALFTSGGPIGILVQTALGAPERSFLEVNWRVKNCSISEFVFSNDRLSLDSFNALPHLEDPKLRTFR